MSFRKTLPSRSMMRSRPSKTILKGSKSYWSTVRSCKSRPCTNWHAVPLHATSSQGLTRTFGVCTRKIASRMQLQRKWHRDRMLFLRRCHSSAMRWRGKTSSFDSRTYRHMEIWHTDISFLILDFKWLHTFLSNTNDLASLTVGSE